VHEPGIYCARASEYSTLTNRDICTFVVQPIADRVAQNLEIISEKRSIVYQAYQNSHGIDHLLLGTNRKSHGLKYGFLEKF